jgi:hypothetical protein
VWCPSVEGKKARDLRTQKICLFCGINEKKHEFNLISIDRQKVFDILIFSLLSKLGETSFSFYASKIGVFLTHQLSSLT